MSESGLTPLEHDVIATLVRHDHPVMKALRGQLAVCRVTERRFTGVGFFTTLDVPRQLAIARLERLTLGDIEVEIDGVPHGAGFVLFVTDGMLDFLEGFTFDSPWPDSVHRYQLRPSVAKTGWRNSPTDLEQVNFIGPIQLYVRVFDGERIGYQPAEAERIDRATAKLLGPMDFDPREYTPPKGTWEFPPGSIVRIERQTFDDDDVRLVAVALTGS